MILIKKGLEPRSLTEYKKQPYAYFDGCNKEDIKNSLLAEQGFLCAYCMRRIHDPSDVTIEHYVPQHPQDGSDSGNELDYNNMLGVCLGNRGCSHDQQTCDAHRGNIPLKVNPFDQESINQILYCSDGTIYSEDPDINNDLNCTLNLNCKFGYLIINRKQAIDALKRYLLKQQPTGQWSKPLLLKVKEAYSVEDGEKQEYLGIILFYINKYLRKCQ